ncbi:MAG: hypothetical protein MJ247_03345 [Alphaproteobacteria bacterium]|nr:hypothetical protein [Alphaproteobacteria bacterium]
MVKTKQSSLNDAFNSSIVDGIEKTNEEKRNKRLQALIDKACKNSSIAKETIEAAIAKGTQICFDHELEGVNGCFIPVDNMILLNENAKDDRLISTLVHESRHVLQKDDCDRSYNCKSYISNVRAMEADAMATQCAALFQFASNDLNEPLVDFVSAHPVVALAYSNSLHKEKNIEKAKEAAFKAWYSDKYYVNAYDKQSCDYLSYIGAEFDKKSFKKNLSAEELAGQYPYVPVDFFKSRDANTVSEEVASRATNIEKFHIRNFFSNIFDKSSVKVSADDFYVRDLNGNIKPPKNKKNEKQKVNVALLKTKGNSR